MCPSNDQSKMTRNSFEIDIIPIDEMFKGITTINKNKSLKFYQDTINSIAYCSIDPTSRAMGVELLPLTQIDKWLQAANVLDMISVTTTDTGLCFFKFRKRAINYAEFLVYIEDLAKFKQIDLDEVKLKLQSCVKPVHPDDQKKKKKRLV